MKYFERTALYYTVLAKEILGGDYLEKFCKIAPVFLCDSKSYKAFEKLFSNTCFISLNTVDFIEQHKCWLSAFCHDNKEFGKNAFEYEALTIKQQALELIDKLDEDLTSVDYIDALSRLYEKDKSLCVTYALLLWLNGCNKNKIVSMLKKAIKDEVNAGIILMYIEEDTPAREAICRDIYNNILQLKCDIIEEIITYYGLNREKILNQYSNQTF